MQPISCCQHCLFLARHWCSFCQSKWLVNQVCVAICRSVLENRHVFLCWTKYVSMSFGDMSHPEHWAPAALSIYLDFALMFVLRCSKVYDFKSINDFGHLKPLNGSLAAWWCLVCDTKKSEIAARTVIRHQSSISIWHELEILWFQSEPLCNWEIEKLNLQIVQEALWTRHLRHHINFPGRLLISQIVQ